MVLGVSFVSNGKLTCLSVFQYNSKLMVLGVPILKHIQVLVTHRKK